MAFVVQCPNCSREVKLADTAREATCLKCFSTFPVVRPGAEPAPEPPRAEPARPEPAPAPEATEAPPAPWEIPSRPARKRILPRAFTFRDVVEEAQEEEPAAPAGAWVNPWGLAALALALAGLVQASLLGVRVLSIALAAGGLVLGIVGGVLSRGQRGPADRVWLALAQTASVLLLVVVLAAPGWLNRLWGVNATVPAPDLDAQEYVDRFWPKLKLRTPAAGDWADAQKEAIRQWDVVVRVDGCGPGAGPLRGPEKYLVIQLGLMNAGHREGVTFTGFAAEPNRPVVADESGQAYRLVEQRVATPAKGEPPAFGRWEGQPLALAEHKSVAVQLVFEPSPPLAGSFKLELPASAWGRHGACRFRIKEYFDADSVERERKERERKSATPPEAK